MEESRDGMYGKDERGRREEVGKKGKKRGGSRWSERREEGREEEGSEGMKKVGMEWKGRGRREEGRSERENKEM